MLRGILLGSAWGLILGGGGLAILSLAYPATVLPPPETGAEVAPEATGAVSETDAAPSVLPRPLSAPERHDAAQITRPDGDTLAAIAPGDLDSGPPPVLVAPDAGLGQGPDAAASAGLEPGPEASVLPSPQSMPPSAPGPDAGPEISTQPKLPPRADPGEEITGFPASDLTETAAAPDPATPLADDAPGAEASAAEAAESTTDSAAGDPATAEADAPAPEEAPVVVVETAPEAAELAESPEDSTPEDEISEGMAPEDMAPDAEAAPDGAIQTAQAETEESELVTADETSSTSETLGTEAPGVENPDTEMLETDTPVETADAPATVPPSSEDPAGDASVDTADAPAPIPPSSENSNPDTTVDTAEAPDADTDAETDTPPPATTSLPVITAPQDQTAGQGDAQPEVSMPGQRALRLTEAAPQPNPVAPPETAPVADTAPPVDRYAQPFDNPEAKPILSIVLIDSAEAGATEDIPARFPYPISVAVPVDMPDAAARMARYRAAGYEVLALASLPDGATPADVETSAQDWARTLPEAVAVMEDPTRPLQSGRENGEQLASILSDSGYGLLLYPDGLDTTRKLASRRGVPAATVFRDLDAEGQSGAVVRRFLDHSAFKASSEGSVILVARPRADTLEALLLWGLADRASRVALAPVSYALKAAAP